MSVSETESGKCVHAMDEAGYVYMAPPEQELPVNAMRVGLDAPLSREGVEHPFGEEAAL